ncbi:MAG TPA: S8 family serine peptidase [Pyrinomonadaceae bacterium]|nr:S8 family serine peptidase [Pyrinomonadaceae bacterium]
MSQLDGTGQQNNSAPDLWSVIKEDNLWRQCTGRGVRVAVVDSGIDTEHPDLKGKVRESVEAVAVDGKINFQPSTSGDQAGHGTACAGIITSVAPDVELYSVKVLGPNASGSGDMFLVGLDYAIKQKFQVINLSLGTTKRDYFAPIHDLMDRAYHAGCTIVAAANNLPYPSYPSIFSSSVVSVIKRTGGDPFNFGYRYGHVIELVAPGVEVKTTWPGGGYRQLTGNSFACPYIAGIIALLIEAYPNLTPFQVKTILYTIAKQNQQRAAAGRTECRASKAMNRTLYRLVDSR